MKQKLLLKTMLLLCALIVGSGTMWGTDVTYKLTIDANDFNTTSYVANNNEKTSDAVCTTDGSKTFEVKWTSNQVMKSGTNMQWQKSKGYIYNSTDLGTINSVTVTSSAGSFTTYYGTSEQPSSGTSGAGKGYFKASVGGVTGTTSKVEITFTVSEAEPSKVVTPTFSVAEGTYNNTQSVTLSCSTDGATIYYTTDGTTPTSSSTPYSSAISVSSTGTTIKAIGIKDGLDDSDVASATYTLKAANPAFSVSAGTCYEAKSVELTCATEGATIRYTTDGNDPTESSDVYASAISVDASQTIKAKAFKTGFAGSDVASAEYTLKCNAPTFDPAAGIVAYNTQIALNAAAGTTIYYTTNGDIPTTSSTVYDSSNKPAIEVAKTIKAIATKSGWTDSDVSSAAYTVNYTITGVSNDEDKGTVAVSSTTITATPKSGYRVIAGDGGYTVTAGTATVVNNGDNTFTVTPATNCTVQINFEAIPTHTVTFYVNGNTDRTATVAEGSSITFPTAVETIPGDGEFPKVVNGKTFVGWYTSEYSHATTAPTYVNTASATMSTSNVTYYAVYADVEEVESDDVKDAVKSQTLEYDTWTYSGSTTDKTSYRMFHTNSYIESAAFDLSKLIKVVVKGGTFGGGTYNSLTIGDGTNTWKNVTVSGNSETGNNEYTDGTALSGTKALRITCNSGTASSTGVRISKVEIYVKGTNTTYVNFTTDNRTSAGIAFANSEVDVKLTSGYTGQALTNPNSLTVAYSSSDETVATVNASTGAVTELLKAGTTTITATFAGNATYKPAEVSYDLNVTEKTPHGLAYATDAVEKLTTDAAFTNTLTNAHSLTVSYSSSATGVATVNSSTGEVTIKGAGSATITATFAGNEDYEAGDASYTLTVSKATPTLSFASANATLRQGKDFEGNALTNPAGLTVSYSSSTTSVATVNSSTGVPAFVAAGSTTITASFAGNDTYTSAEATYTLKVLAAPTISLSDDNVDWGDTYTFDASGLSSYGDVTLISGNTSIATVDGLVITPAACGTVTITVSTAENETYDAGSETFDLTINAPEGSDKAPSGNVLLFGESFGDNTGSIRDWSDTYSVKTGVSGVYSGITGYTVSNAGQGKNTTGSTKSGLNQRTAGTDAYIIIGPLNVASYSNMTLKYQWKAASIGATYSTSAYYKTSAGGDFTEITGGTGAGATSFVERSYTVPAAAQVSTLYLKIVWNTSNTQGIIDEVQLITPAVTSKDVTLNKYGYATFCSDKPMDFTSTTGYTAWRVNSIAADGAITFKKVTEVIKGGQGVLLYNKNADGKNTSDVTVNFADGTTVFDDGSDANDENDNLMLGTTAPTYVTTVKGDYTNFGLKGSEFLKINTGVIPTGKAYLPVPTSIVEGLSADARLTFVFEDSETTGISDASRLKDNGEMRNDNFFNLKGQRVEKPTKGGLYIVNGKKVVIK